MKKLVSSLLLGAMIFAFADVQARNVSEAEARSAAAYYFSLNATQVKDDALTLVHQIDNMELGVPECYMYNVENGGWIIMAGSALITPVVAYSEEGRLPDTYTDLPENMRWWVNGYADMIGDIQAADAEGKYEDYIGWTNLLEKRLNPSKTASSVVLVRTKWDQGQPNKPSYNKFCPKVNGKYCYTGCVATAMAQIIRYWECPAQPEGIVSHSWRGTTLEINSDTVHFDYSLMPISITDAYGQVNVPVEQVDQVAMLNYFAGVSVYMDYDIGEGSGTQSRYVPSAFLTNFRYVKSKMINRAGNNDTSFVGRVRRNLESKCPVYFSGTSSIGGDAHAAGHAWVCGGYKTDDENPDNNNMVLMNWGWSGSGNGWFNLMTNNMEMSVSYTRYNFNDNQSAIVGLYPVSADSTVVDFLGVPEVEDYTELAPAYPNPATLSVMLPYEITSAAEMVVYSIDGKVVTTRSLQPGEGTVKLNVSDMPSGIYIYRVGGKSGKFMVQ